MSQSSTKLIFEIDFVHPNDSICDDQLIDQCKAIFIRIMRKLSSRSVRIREKKDVLQPLDHRAGFLIEKEGAELVPNGKTIAQKWPVPIQHQFVSRCVQLILDHLDDQDFNTYTLAEKLNLSKASFYRRIKWLTGVSAKDFIKLIKMQSAFQLLAEKNFTVSEVSWKCGYSSVRHFSKLFFQTYKALPSRIFSSRVEAI